MVIGTNSVPTGIPSLGCGEEGNFIQCKKHGCGAARLWNSPTVLQLNKETAWLWHSMAARWPSGQAPLSLDSSALLYLLCFGKISLVFQFQLRKHSSVERESMLS